MSKFEKFNKSMRCMKIVGFGSFSGPYFLAFGVNMKRHGVSLRT